MIPCFNVLLYCLLYFKRGGSCIGFPDWIKDKISAIIPVNKTDNTCFQYTVTVALSHDKIKKDPQIITKIKPLIDKYNWEGINYPSEIKLLGKIGKLLLLVCMLKIKKYNLPIFQNKTQVILLMISNRERLYYLAVQKIICIVQRNNIKK